MNDAGESCFPSIATLMKECSLSNRSVIDHIKQAKEAGWIKVGLHGFGGQKWRSHEYTCAIPEIDYSGRLHEIPVTRNHSPDKARKAQKYISNAIYSNRIIKQPCFECGSGNAEAHHFDYDKPSEVFWLCRLHHKKLHQMEKRGERASPGIEKRGEPLSIEAEERGEPASKNVVKEVHSSTSVTNSTLSDNSTRDAPPIGSDPVIQPQPSLPAKRKNPIFSPALMDIPDWLDREVWAMWCEERAAKRKPITYRAGLLQLKKLAEYRDQGFSPQEVIEHSIASGYQGLFPPRGNQHENRRSNSNGFNAIDPNDESWLTDDALAYIESGREIGNRVRAGKPLLRRDDDGVYRLATGDDG
jgi:hypothetical protein